jgi:hypothetical protein
MKLIVAGGRDYFLTEKDWNDLTALCVEHRVDEIITGGCSGVDRDAEEFAGKMGIRHICFPAEWNKYGRSAGPIRNAEMALHGDAVALFPGGRGTESMHKEALRQRLRMFDFRNKSQRSIEELEKEKL